MVFQIDMNTATTRMSRPLLTIKALASVREKVTIWPEFSEEDVTICTASNLSNAARCMMVARWQTGGKLLTKKAGSNVIQQSITSLGYIGIITGAKMIRSPY